MEIAAVLDFPLDYGFGRNYGGEAQFAENEQRMIDAIQRARHYLVRAASHLEAASDGIGSDEEEQMILKRRGAESFPEWAQKISDRLGKEWEPYLPTEPINFAVAYNELGRETLEILFQSIHQHLIRPVEELEGALADWDKKHGDDT